MLRLPVLICLVLLTACTSEQAPEREAVPAAPASTAATPVAASATAAPTEPPSAAPAGDPSDVRIAVIRRGGGLELHRIDRAARAATLERVLEPPVPQARALDVTAGGSLVCATWHVAGGDLVGDAPTSLVCYADGSSRGRVVDGPEQPHDVAVSADGRQIAWADFDEGGNQTLTTARLTGSGVTGQRGFLARAGLPPGAFLGTAVQDLAWAAGGVLTVSTAVESDDDPALLRFDPAAAKGRGWLEAGVRVEAEGAGYLTYDSVATARGSTALAVRRGSYLDEGRPPSQAVRVALTTGDVLDVLATAAEGREVVAVSGDEEAVVYVTAAGRDLRTYLRLAADRRGEQVAGLPADTTEVLALP